jgi:hypothetical protein
VKEHGMNTTRFHLVSSLMMACALLSGCGGGGGDAPALPATGTVPVSATASPQAYTRYAQSLAPDDAAEPLRIDTVASAPVSESDEPVSLD